MTTRPFGDALFIKTAESSGTQIAKFYTGFQQAFDNKLPDERGLTDQFLLGMYQGIVRSGLDNPAFDVTQYSQKDEGTTGSDYLWTFKVLRQATGANQQFWCYLQAKNFKDSMADFNYKSSTGRLQMDILHDYYLKQREEHKQPGDAVRAGYILYGPDYVQFLHIETALQFRDQAIGKKVPVNKYISAEVYNRPTYMLATILDAFP